MKTNKNTINAIASIVAPKTTVSKEARTQATAIRLQDALLKREAILVTQEVWYKGKAHKTGFAQQMRHAVAAVALADKLDIGTYLLPEEFRSRYAFAQATEGLTQLASESKLPTGYLLQAFGVSTMHIADVPETPLQRALAQATAKAPDFEPELPRTSDGLLVPPTPDPRCTPALGAEVIAVVTAVEEAIEEAVAAAKPAKPAKPAFAGIPDAPAVKPAKPAKKARKGKVPAKALMMG